MFLARREPDNITGGDLLDWAALALHEAKARGNDQRLPKRMRVPRGARTGLEGDARAHNARWFGRLEQGIHAHRAREIFGWTFARGLRAASFDFHKSLLFQLPCCTVGCSCNPDLGLASPGTSRDNRHALMSEFDKCSGKISAISWLLWRSRGSAALP